MPVSLDYVARETASNLWRNRLMTIAAVLTVAVSLSLVGAALLVRQGVAQATTEWQHQVNVIVWLEPQQAAPAQLTAQQTTIEQQLLHLPYVRRCIFRNQQYDFTEANHLLDPVLSQALSVQTTPASLRCTLDQASEAQAIVRQFRDFPGVAGVDYPGQAVRTMEHFFSAAQVVAMVLAVVLLLSASVLIINTIRLAIFARRREVSVMKLVGATNWFIRVPFMCEGIVQGVVGAAVATGMVFLLYWVLDHVGGGPTSFTHQMHLPLGEVVVTSIVVLLVGVIIGSAGSALGIRRFLDA